MQDRIREAIRTKLGDAADLVLPPFIPRETSTDPWPGKARAVIGMRRAGKTTFLYQCLAARLAAGTPRERLVYFNFEDDRLDGMMASDLGEIVEEYYRVHPEFRRRERVTWALDEIQVVPGWERWVRRIMDSEEVEVLLSGSSARMLSREVATTMRGRALETVITPFSLREFGKARGSEPPSVRRLVGAAERSEWLAHLDAYLETGGFPEAGQPALRSHRVQLLQGYVDAMVFRDVAERHGIGNLAALRALVRQLLRQPACLFSVTQIHGDFQSRGIGASKETLLAMLGHLEDAFLVFTVPIASRSERRQQVNPRKLYLADHGLAAAYNPSPRRDRGLHLENIVACELLRRGSTLAYVKTPDGHEVDFLATHPDGSEELLQVAAEVGDSRTFEREVRALLGAAQEFPNARRTLVTEKPPPHGMEVPKGIEVVPAWRWLVETSLR